MRICLSIVLWGCAAANAATLEKLSFDDMASKSSAIVRARIGSRSVKQHGPLFLTHYAIRVEQQWKGTGAPSTMDVVVPGGTIGNRQQTVAGAPILVEGAELVLFLWKSSTGLNHVIGLSQGVFRLEKSEGGQWIVDRAPISEGLFDRNGRPAHDSGMRMSMREFDTRVRSVVGKDR